MENIHCPGGWDVIVVSSGDITEDDGGHHGAASAQGRQTRISTRLDVGLRKFRIQLGLSTAVLFCFILDDDLTYEGLHASSRHLRVRICHCLVLTSMNGLEHVPTIFHTKMRMWA